MLSPLRRTILWRYENAPYSHRYSAGRHAQPAEHLANANRKLERRYAEPTLVYQQRGTSAGAITSRVLLARG